MIVGRPVRWRVCDPEGDVDAVDAPGGPGQAGVGGSGDAPPRRCALGVPPKYGEKGATCPATPRYWPRGVAGSVPTTSMRGLRRDAAERTNGPGYPLYDDCREAEVLTAVSPAPAFVTRGRSKPF